MPPSKGVINAKDTKEERPDVGENIYIQSVTRFQPGTGGKKTFTSIKSTINSKCNSRAASPTDKGEKGIFSRKRRPTMIESAPFDVNSVLAKLKDREEADVDEDTSTI